jgi:hypothetical protein
MKKLLALLIVALVIGSVFAGPVHINGPGINTGDIYEFTFSEDFGLAGISRSPSIAQDTPAFDVGGAVAVDSQGVITPNLFSGSSGLPFIITTTQIATFDSQNFVLEDVGRSQEVISLLGCSKPAYTGNVLS